MITPELIDKVAKRLDKAVDFLMKAVNEVRSAWEELAKRNVEMSSLGVLLAKTEAELRNVVTRLDTLVHTWEVVRNAPKTEG